MAKKNDDKCRCCKAKFIADVRNRGRQEYCSKPQCQRESKAASQRRWLAKPENRDYFKGEQNAARARQWQQAHPRYWKNTVRYRHRTLQETSSRNALISDKNNASGARGRGSAAAPLQEVLKAQKPLLIGLIATLTDSPLQDDIAATSRRLLQLGQDILAGASQNAAQTGSTP